MVILTHGAMTLGLILFILAALPMRFGLCIWRGSDLKSSDFFWPVRVYYEDTDAGGVVYHARYLNFLERSRTEWLRSLGVEQDDVLAATGLLFLVSRITVDYLRAARFNQQLQVMVRPQSPSGVRLPLLQEVHDLVGTVYCRAEVTVVCVRAGDLKPVRLPRFLTEELSNGLR